MQILELAETRAAADPRAAAAVLAQIPGLHPGEADEDDSGDKFLCGICGATFDTAGVLPRTACKCTRRLRRLRGCCGGRSSGLTVR